MKFQIWHTDWPLGVPTKKCKIRSNGVAKGSRDLLFEISDPLHISATVKAINFKFGMEIGHWGTKRKNCKIGPKGVVKGHVTYFLKFWNPLYISATVEARNFKFGMQIGHSGT